MHQSTVHTLQGIINASEAIILLVPKTDNLTVEPRFAPQDVNHSRLGQTALLRF